MCVTFTDVVLVVVSVVAVMLIMVIRCYVVDSGGAL
jgi:hypothetical protein